MKNYIWVERIRKYKKLEEIDLNDCKDWCDENINCGLMSCCATNGLECNCEE